MQIGMEPLVTDWYSPPQRFPIEYSVFYEEPRMGQIIRHIYVYC